MKSSDYIVQCSLAALCLTTLAGCGVAPVSDKPLEPVAKAAIPEAEPIHKTDTATIIEVEPAVQDVSVVTEPVVEVRRQAFQKPQLRPVKAQSDRAQYERLGQQRMAEAQRLARQQQRLAEVDAKRLAYHQRWEAEQKRKQADGYRQQVMQQRPVPRRQVASPPVYVPAVVSRNVQKISYAPPAPRRMDITAAVSNQVGGRGTGNYYAPSVTGSFAGQPVVANLIESLVRKGFDRGYLNGVFSQAQYRDDVAQIWAKYYAKGGEQPKVGQGGGGYPSYRGKFLTPGNLAKGRQFWNTYAAHLRRAEQQYGVPSEYIVGIIGVETRWGEIFGKHRILEALLTSAIAVPHRANFFLGEVENFMLMTRSERMDPLTPKGSYAGAMGYGQFMPSSFRSYAVDFDGDGIRDLWNPVDAIGSVANYFAKHGWRAGEDVVVAAQTNSNNYQSMPDGFKVKYSLGSLAQNGIQPAQPYRASGKVHLLALSHDGGKDAWIGFNNFYVITRYNHSNYYAMTVHELGQAIKQGVGAIYAQR